MIFDLVVLTLTVLPLVVGLSLMVKPQTVKDIVGSWTRSTDFLKEASLTQARVVGAVVVLISAYIAISVLKTVEENRFFYQMAERRGTVTAGGTTHH